MQRSPFLLEFMALSITHKQVIEKAMRVVQGHVEFSVCLAVLSFLLFDVMKENTL